MNQQRQGDLYFIKINSLPKGLRKQKTGALVHSDTTNHTHLLTKGDFLISKEGKMYLNLKTNSTVVHEEHGVNKLDKGLYEVRRQRHLLREDLISVVVD